MSRDLRAELRGVLPENTLNLVTRSFDILGSKRKAVAIIEIPDELEDYESAIAEALMRVNKNVTSVLSKESGRRGEYRTRDLRLIAGDPDTEVLHRESGCVFRLDPRRVYFSPRESSERSRLVSAAGEDEDVLVMFSGVGPIPIRLAKEHSEMRITAVELNPIAHNYCVDNIHLNRVSGKIGAFQGDVRTVCPSLGRLYDRVLMPLPKGAYRYLDVAIPVLKDVGVLHFYHWAPQEDLYSEAEQLITQAAINSHREVEFLDHVKVSQYSPGTWKVRVDARLERSQHHSE